MSEEQFYVICVSPDLKPDFEFRKIYLAQLDKKGSEAGLIRIWNEFDEDYLYSSQYFKTVNLTNEIKEALAISA